MLRPHSLSTEEMAPVTALVLFVSENFLMIPFFCMQNDLLT